MKPEIKGKIEETVLDVLRNADLEEMTEFKVREAASERLGIDLSGKECRSFVRNLVEYFLLSTADEAQQSQSVREETKEVVREQQEVRVVNKEVYDDGDRHICELSKKRSVTVQDFRGKTMVSIREFYLKDGKRVHTAKGISLPAEQWSNFKKSVPAIEEAIRKMESRSRSKLDDKKSEDTSYPVTSLPPCETFPAEIVRLDGKNYQCWAQNIELMLKQLNIAYVLFEPCPSIMLGREASTEEITRAKAAEQKWMNDDRMCRHNILSSLSDYLLNLYSKKPTTAKELWEELKLLHLYEEFGTKRSQVKKYIEFQMVEEKPILEQVQELNCIADKIAAAGMLIEENFHVSVIISKLPLSWKDISIKLMFEEHLPFWMLMRRLKVEEELRMQDKQGMPNPVSNNLAGKAVPRMRDARPQVCYTCGKKGHSYRQCYSKKVDKEINGKRDKDNGSTPAITEVNMVDGAING
ncbi:uncharacterized protein LOC107423619 [Ziziphus jujuba]|uniref:Uncharacterized protein LOC107423619 n=1 Tax=Ziziphus jujuba TaxID=326968 RepID=A0ABM3IUS8_ZIZJJ|nr:uncharacterized protein LOC107423619 [Ziziphus jujuba]